MNNTVKVLIAAAAGAAVGAALGILFAPAKGEDTRENIMKKSKDFADEVAKRFRNVKEDAKSKAETFS